MSDSSPSPSKRRRIRGSATKRRLWLQTQTDGLESPVKGRRKIDARLQSEEIPVTQSQPISKLSLLALRPTSSNFVDYSAAIKCAQQVAASCRSFPTTIYSLPNLVERPPVKQTSSYLEELAALRASSPACGPAFPWEETSVEEKEPITDTTTEHQSIQNACDGDNICVHNAEWFDTLIRTIKSPSFTKELSKVLQGIDTSSPQELPYCSRCKSKASPCVCDAVFCSQCFKRGSNCLCDIPSLRKRTCRVCAEPFPQAFRCLRRISVYRCPINILRSCAPSARSRNWMFYTGNAARMTRISTFNGHASMTVKDSCHANLVNVLMHRI